MVEYEEMNELLLCRKMNWLWTDLQQQPSWFIEHMIRILNEETRQKPK